MTGNVAGVVVAGGRGSRAGGDVPKQYRTLGNIPVLRQSLAVFATHDQIAWVQPVIHRDDGEFYARAAEGLRVLPPAFGAATRQGSLRAGLEPFGTATPPSCCCSMPRGPARPLPRPRGPSRPPAPAPPSQPPRSPPP